MKKAFTMIELIFVIVILGILASVAIPRLAATREDAEISAAVANLRTLVSDVSAYYTAKGDFGSATWNQITNVPLATTGTDTAAKAVGTAATAKLKVGGKDCIGVHLVENATPAHIVFTKENNGGSVCDQVQKSDPLKVYLESRLPSDSTATGKMAIGSSTSVYTKPTTTNQSNGTQ